MTDGPTFWVVHVPNTDCFDVVQRDTNQDPSILGVKLLQSGLVLQKVSIQGQDVRVYYSYVRDRDEAANQLAEVLRDFFPTLDVRIGTPPSQ